MMCRRGFWREAGLLIGLAVGLSGGWVQADQEKLKLLIVDGHNNHNWRATTPVLTAIFRNSGRFEVDVATAPQDKSKLNEYAPKFSDYDVVVSNYNGPLWPEQTRKAFEQYVRGGGGFVTVHAANNSFPQWGEYNVIIGLGGWGGRNERSGPYVRWEDGKITRDTSRGRGGSHGRQHAFTMIHRDTEHPITKGLPPEWMHVKDELYDRLRGPAVNLHVLATAYSDPATRGTGKHEPLLMTINYGQGRCFHTALGHSPQAMHCVGFQTTLVRGAEWAATGEVTLQKVPEDFPSDDQVSQRKPS